MIKDDPMTESRPVTSERETDDAYRARIAEDPNPQQRIAQSIADLHGELKDQNVPRDVCDAVLTIAECIAAYGDATRAAASIIATFRQKSPRVP